MLWEPPAGLLDVGGEPPIAAAQRELGEEAGYRAEQWAVLVDAFTSPGMTDEAMRVYLARELTAVPEPGRRRGEHEEAGMPLRWLDLDDAVSLVLAGRLHNPTAVMGLLAASRARERGWSELRPADAPWPERPVSGTKR
jgi:ADP-ribose pyrophosphatase